MLEGKYQKVAMKYYGQRVEPIADESEQSNAPILVEGFKYDKDANEILRDSWF